MREVEKHSIVVVARRGKLSELNEESNHRVVENLHNIFEHSTIFVVCYQSTGFYSNHILFITKKERTNEREKLIQQLSQNYF